MRASAPPLWPDSLGIRLAGRGRRAARAILSGLLLVVLTGATLWGLGRIFVPGTPLRSLRLMTDAAWPVLIRAVLPDAGVVAFGLIGLVWVAITGRTPLDAALGLRLVRVDGSGRPGAGAFARGLVVSLFGLLTGGLVPLLLAVAGRDEAGRHWQDRWSGLALLDVRHGRDLTRHPLTPAEIRLARMPAQPAIQPIVTVRPDIGSLGPAPQATGFGTAPGLTPAPAAVQAGAPVTSGGPWPAAGAPAGEPSWGEPRPSGPGLTLRFDTGQSCQIHGLALAGRAPTPQRGYEGAQLVTVQDQSKTVSNTHLAIIDAGGKVWVCDLGSTNGSAILTTSGREEPLAAGVRTLVPRHARVRLGDRVVHLQGGRA